MSENLPSSSPQPDADIKRMEELLNAGEVSDSPANDLSKEPDKLDYNQPHAEIINTIQTIMGGELADDFNHDSLRDRLYGWLSDYKEFHSLEDFLLLVKELHSRFVAQQKTNRKVQLLFEVLAELI